MDTMHKADVISIDTAVKQPFTMLVDGKPYMIEFPLSAVIAAEGKIGRSLKTPADWYTAPAKDIPALIEAGLAKHHPDVDAAEIGAICESLNPESIVEITAALGALAFPRWTANYEDMLRKVKERGDVSPNVPSADAL